MTENDNNSPMPEPRSAAEWLVRRRGRPLHDVMTSPEAAQEDATFAAWRAADARNADAFGRMEQLWAELGALRDSPVVRDAMMEPADAPIPTPAPEKAGRGSLFRYGAVAAAWLAVAILGFQLYETVSGRPVDYSTGAGEQMTVVLRDGSEVTLNTRTRLHVDMTGEQRRITLQAGEAFFRVAHDPGRPFVVTAGDTNVRAIGTAFGVHRRDNGTVAVVVSQGKVQVDRAPVHADGAAGQHQAMSVRLVRGQMIDVTPVAAKLSPEPVAIDHELAWTDGVLDFSATPLRDVVAEVNRYGTTRIVIADHRLDELTVSGVFNIRDVESFAPLLEQLLPVSAVSDSAGVVRLVPRDADKKS